MYVKFLAARIRIYTITYMYSNYEKCIAQQTHSYALRPYLSHIRSLKKYFIGNGLLVCNVDFVILRKSVSKYRMPSVYKSIVPLIFPWRKLCLQYFSYDEYSWNEKDIKTITPLPQNHLHVHHYHHQQHFTFF